MRRVLRKIAAMVLLSCLIGADGSIADARTRGVVLRPENEQQKQACGLLIQGTQLLKAKEPFKARPFIEQAAGLWPQSPYIHFNLGCCYQDMGNFSMALTAYQQALKLDPEFVDCIPNMGSCYQLMGKPKEAIAVFQDYLKKNPEAADAQEIAGMIRALGRQSPGQMLSDPQESDYLQLVAHGGRPQRWPEQKLPLRIYISCGTDDKGHHVEGFREQYNEYLLSAFEAWVKASNNRLAFRLVSDVNQADIVCTWTDRRDFLPIHGDNVEQGAARVSSRPVKGGNEDEIGHAKVVILILNMEGKPLSDDTMKKACLHEVGHALGLAGHSNNNKDVMFYCDSPAVWPALTKRDQATMAQLYGNYRQLTAD